MTDNATTQPEFNPSGDGRVEFLKERTQELMDWLRREPAIDPRCKALAITSYEVACMWAVKSLFVQPANQAGPQQASS